MSGRIWSRSGNAFSVPVNFLSSTSTQSGQPTWVAIARAAAMRTCAFDFSRTETTSPAAHWYEGTFTVSPFTSIALCDTSWRASARVVAKPMR